MTIVLENIPYKLKLHPSEGIEHFIKKCIVAYHLLKNNLLVFFETSATGLTKIVNRKRMVRSDRKMDCERCRGQNPECILCHGRGWYWQTYIVEDRIESSFTGYIDVYCTNLNRGYEVCDGDLTKAKVEDRKKYPCEIVFVDWDTVENRNFIKTHPDINVWLIDRTTFKFTCPRGTLLEWVGED